MKSRRRRAGIDLDGCLYYWSATAAFLLNHHWGLTLGESTSWNYIQENVSTAAWTWLWREGVEQHGLFRHGNCYKGAFEFLDTVSRRGFDIVVITSRPENAQRDTLDWLAYHRVPAREVHIIGHTDKKSKVRPLCDWYVDDKPENIADLETTGRPAFLMDRPWNQDAKPQRRVLNWIQLLEAIE